MAVNSVVWRYVWATGSVAALGAAWYVAYLTVGAGTEAITYIFVPVGAVFAAASIRHMCRSLDLDPVARRFWRSQFFTLALISIGYSWLAEDMLTHVARARVRSMPMPAAACVALGFGIAIWAVARVPIITTGGTERWRIALDRTIAFLGCATVLWYLGLAPMLTAREPWSRQTTVLVGLAFLLTVGAVTKVSYVAGGPVDRAAMRFFALRGPNKMI